MRAKKIDANQNSIVENLRKIPGISVCITSSLGNGFVDIVVGVNDSRNYLIELKDGNKPPSARKLTEEESKFHANWKGQIAVASSLEDCLKIIGI
jgi:hypothetical protein